jgi:hypothetical protein
VERVYVSDQLIAEPTFELEVDHLAQAVAEAMGIETSLLLP